MSILSLEPMLAVLAVCLSLSVALKTAALRQVSDLEAQQREEHNPGMNPTLGNVPIC